MNLNTITESDLEFILEDSIDGFGVDITITTKAGIKKIIQGQSTDIGVLIDPTTGVGVIGRNCEIVFRISTLLSELGEIPQKSESGDDWYIFEYENTNSEIWRFGIEQVHVDRKLGVAKFIIGLVDITI